MLKFRPYNKSDFNSPYSVFHISNILDGAVLAKLILIFGERELYRTNYDGRYPQRTVSHWCITIHPTFRVSAFQYLLGDKNSRFLKSMLKIFKLVLLGFPGEPLRLTAIFLTWNNETCASGHENLLRDFLLIFTLKINFNNGCLISTGKGSFLFSPPLSCWGVS